MPDPWYWKTTCRHHSWTQLFLLSLWMKEWWLNGCDIYWWQVVGAMKRILYAAEDDASVVAEAQAMLSEQQQEVEEEGKQKSDSQKRKSIINVDVEAAASNTLSPRQRLSEVSDVHCSGSPLVTYWSSLLLCIYYNIAGSIDYWPAANLVVC